MTKNEKTVLISSRNRIKGTVEEAVKFAINCPHVCNERFATELIKALEGDSVCCWEDYDRTRKVKRVCYVDHGVLVDEYRTWKEACIEAIRWSDYSNLLNEE